MIIKEPGQVYTLQTAEGMDVIDIHFCRKVNGTFVDGITNEEMINILVDRLSNLVKNLQIPENVNALRHVQQAKHYINIRNLNKIKRQKEASANTRHGV